MNGTGLTPAVLSIAPAGLTFPATLLGQLSATQTVTVTNSGQVGISDLQVAVTAGFGLDPAKTTCTQTLSGGASCTVGVLFAPTAGGAITGGLTATSALSGAIAATATLAGSGALPPGILPSPAALVQFPTTGVGQPATPVQVTITNQGTLSALNGLNLTVDTTGTQNGFSLSANTCVVTLAPAASCTVNVAFAPTAVGSLTGTLILSSANGGASTRLQLVGIGFDFHINVLGSNSITVVQGQTAYYTLALSTLGGVTQGSGGKYTFQCANLPANALCLFNPQQLSVLPTGVTGNDMLGIGTGAAALNVRAQSSRRLSTLPGAALLFCSLLALRLRKSKASRHLLLLTLMLAGVVSAVSSCAGAGGSGGELHLGGGTPPATYTVTVSASVNNLTHTVNVTLIVN